MARISKHEPSSGIQMAAKKQFEARRPLLEGILDKAACEHCLVLEENMRKKVIGRMVVEVEIEANTLRPIISVQIPSDVARMLEFEARNGQGKVARPQAHQFLEALMRQVNDAMDFDPIEVFPELVLNYALLPEEARAIHQLTAQAAVSA